MTIQEILWCSWNIYLGKNSPPFLSKVPKCPSRNLVDIWEDPSSYFWKSGCDVKEVEIEASGQRREGGGRKENRQQLERPTWRILKKKQKQNNTLPHREQSFYSSGKEHRAEKNLYWPSLLRWETESAESLADAGGNAPEKVFPLPVPSTAF